MLVDKDLARRYFMDGKPGQCTLIRTLLKDISWMVNKDCLCQYGPCKSMRTELVGVSWMLSKDCTFRRLLMINKDNVCR